MTLHHNNHESAAKNIVAQVGKAIVIAVPVGIGKPVGLLNALYRLAEADQTIVLTIITGLTLARPSFHNKLEKLFVEPILERLLKNYEDPLYERARELQQLPANIKVIEFFLTPGKYLHNNYVQQNYISSKYTSVVRDALYLGVNVVAQQFAYSDANPKQYSLSCNADLFHEVVAQLKKSNKAGKKIAIVAELNLNLPYMPGDKALVDVDLFTDTVDTKHYPTLFAVPREQLSAQEQMIGLYASSLVKDDSCLQIGIGKLANAVASALILRHANNKIYQDILSSLLAKEKFSDTLFAVGEQTSFDRGLYGSTEMFSDEYIQLYNNGILKKHVYDHLALQRLLNNGTISESITPDILEILLANNIIHPQLTPADAKFLLKYGILKQGIVYQGGSLILLSGEKITADLNAVETKQKIITHCLGEKLQSGKILHAGFFLGSVELYQQLHKLSKAELNKIAMTSVMRTNTLQWAPKLAQAQRINARFINSAMILTLGGGIVSDGLKNLREVSGVGGQFDFVSMAHVLPGARSIILCASVRMSNGKVVSNIVWDYPNLTIPRFLRDIVVTEYGIADCRSKTDVDILKALLNITDSRFQKSLLAKAKKYGILPQEYTIPVCFQQNYPHFIKDIVRAVQAKGVCQSYPFGSDLTADEEVIERGLLYLKALSKVQLVIFTLRALFFFGKDAKFDQYLLRMKLKKANNLQDFIYKKLLKFAIYRSLVNF